MTETIYFKFSDLPDPVREDFMLKIEDNKIKSVQISPVLEKLFVDSKSLTYSFVLDTTVVK